MNEFIRKVFLANIKSYNKACEIVEDIKIEDRNDINAYFYIITSMRKVYGCPSCSSMAKCSCKVINSISPYIRYQSGENGYPDILW